MTSKGSDQTVRMRRLIRGFAGHTYLIVGNLMSRLNFVLGAHWKGLDEYPQHISMIFIQRNKNIN